MSVLDNEEWVNVKEAGALLGGINHKTVVRLGEEIDPLTNLPYLKLWRPSRGTVLVSKTSLLAHKTRTLEDPFFWDRRPSNEEGQPKKSGYFKPKNN